MKILFAFGVSASLAFGSWFRCASRLAPTPSFETWVALADEKKLSPSPNPHNALPIALVGAGPFGLAMAASLKRRGIPFITFEKFSEVGGLWNSENPDSASYPALTANSSDMTMHLGTPLPGPHRFYTASEALKYLDAYAKAYRLHENIVFNAQVGQARRNSDGTWQIVLRQNGKEEAWPQRFQMVIAGSGRHSYEKYDNDALIKFSAARIPASHTRKYRDAEGYRGKKVLFIGFGNSTADIAHQVARVASKVVISVRTPPWFVPVSALGKPADQLAAETPRFVPHALRMFFFHLLQRWYVGHPNRFGLPTPPHGLLEKPPVSVRGVEEDILAGRVILRGPLSQVHGNRVAFKDGRPPEAIDAVIFGTGYDEVYPYLPYPSDRLKFDRMPSFFLFSRDDDSLVHLLETPVLQSSWSVMHEQAETVAEYIRARNTGTPRFQYFTRVLRHSTPTHFKGKVFSKVEDPRYVDAAIYVDWLRRFRDWISPP